VPENDQKSPRPHVGPAAQTEAALRRERQAAALRENLRRRKARERSRSPRPSQRDESPDEG
jgi:hypothetical protein